MMTCRQKHRVASLRRAWTRSRYFSKKGIFGKEKKEF